MHFLPRWPIRVFLPGTMRLVASLSLHGDLPEGIDCQRCHGPGGSHVDTAQAAGATPERFAPSIVNPARLSPKLRMDLCMQCHLEPTSTAIPALIRRFNRGPFSFTQASRWALSYWLSIMRPELQHDDKFEIVGSSAYRLRQSRCFLESKEALTCDTCHDPHRSGVARRPSRYYAQVCRQCHAAAFDGLVSKGTHPAAAIASPATCPSAGPRTSYTWS